MALGADALCFRHILRWLNGAIRFVDRSQQVFEHIVGIDRESAIEALTQKLELMLGQQTNGNNALIFRQRKLLASFPHGP